MSYGPETTNQDGTLNEVGQKIERCVAQVMKDPNFKPKKGEDKKEAAIAICKASIIRAEEVNKQLQK